MYIYELFHACLLTCFQVIIDQFTNLTETFMVLDAKVCKCAHEAVNTVTQNKFHHSCFRTFSNTFKIYSVQECVKGILFMSNINETTLR